MTQAIAIATLGGHHNLHVVLDNVRKLVRSADNALAEAEWINRSSPLTSSESADVEASVAGAVAHLKAALRRLEPSDA